MAIFHLEHSYTSRSKGGGGRAAAHAGYTARNITHDKFFAYGGAPEFAANMDRKEYRKQIENWWNEKEAENTRSNARLSDRWNLALPRGLTESQYRDLAEDYLSDMASKGMPIVAAIHNTGKDRLNPHLHVQVIDRDAEGKRVLRLSDNKRDRVRDGLEPDGLVALRKDWEQKNNNWMIKNGLGQPENMIDHRSLAAQRDDALAQGDYQRAEMLNRKAQIHIGPQAKHIIDHKYDPASRDTSEKVRQPNADPLRFDGHVTPDQRQRLIHYASKIDHGKNRLDANERIIDDNLERATRSRDVGIRSWAEFEREQRALENPVIDEMRKRERARNRDLKQHTDRAKNRDQRIRDKIAAEVDVMTADLRQQHQEEMRLWEESRKKPFMDQQQADRDRFDAFMEAIRQGKMPEQPEDLASLAGQMRADRQVQVDADIEARRQELMPSLDQLRERHFLAQWDEALAENAMRDEPRNADIFREYAEAQRKALVAGTKLEKAERQEALAGQPDPMYDPANFALLEERTDNPDLARRLNSARRHRENMEAELKMAKSDRQQQGVLTKYNGFADYEAKLIKELETEEAAARAAGRPPKQFDFETLQKRAIEDEQKRSVDLDGWSTGFGPRQEDETPAIKKARRDYYHEKEIAGHRFEAASKRREAIEAALQGPPASREEELMVRYAEEREAEARNTPLWKDATNYDQFMAAIHTDEDVAALNEQIAKSRAAQERPEARFGRWLGEKLGRETSEPEQEIYAKWLAEQDAKSEALNQRAVDIKKQEEEKLAAYMERRKTVHQAREKQWREMPKEGMGGVGQHWRVNPTQWEREVTRAREGMLAHYKSEREGRIDDVISAIKQSDAYRFDPNAPGERKLRKDKKLREEWAEREAKRIRKAEFDSQSYAAWMLDRDLAINKGQEDLKAARGEVEALQAKIAQAMKDGQNPAELNSQLKEASLNAEQAHLWLHSAHLSKANIHDTASIPEINAQMQANAQQWWATRGIDRPDQLHKIGVPAADRDNDPRHALGEMIYHRHQAKLATEKSGYRTDQKQIQELRDALEKDEGEFRDTFATQHAELKDQLQRGEHPELQAFMQQPTTAFGRFKDAMQGSDLERDERINNMRVARMERMQERLQEIQNEQEKEVQDEARQMHRGHQKQVAAREKVVADKYAPQRALIEQERAEGSKILHARFQDEVREEEGWMQQRMSERHQSREQLVALLGKDASASTFEEKIIQFPVSQFAPDRQATMEALQAQAQAAANENQPSVSTPQLAVVNQPEQPSIGDQLASTIDQARLDQLSQLSQKEAALRGDIDPASINEAVADGRITQDAAADWLQAHSELQREQHKLWTHLEKQGEGQAHEDINDAYNQLLDRVGGQASQAEIRPVDTPKPEQAPQAEGNQQPTLEFSEDLQAARALHKVDPETVAAYHAALSKEAELRGEDDPLEFFNQVHRGEIDPEAADAWNTARAEIDRLQHQLHDRLDRAGVTHDDERDAAFNEIQDHARGLLNQPAAPEHQDQPQQPTAAPTIHDLLTSGIGADRDDAAILSEHLSTKTNAAEVLEQIQEQRATARFYAERELTENGLDPDARQARADAEKAANDLEARFRDGMERWQNHHAVPSTNADDREAQTSIFDPFEADRLTQSPLEAIDQANEERLAAGWRPANLEAIEQARATRAEAEHERFDPETLQAMLEDEDKTAAMRQTTDLLRDASQDKDDHLSKLGEANERVEDTTGRSDRLVDRLWIEMRDAGQQHGLDEDKVGEIYHAALKSENGFDGDHDEATARYLEANRDQFEGTLAEWRTAQQEKLESEEAQSQAQADHNHSLNTLDQSEQHLWRQMQEAGEEHDVDRDALNREYAGLLRHIDQENDPKTLATEREEHEAPQTTPERQAAIEEQQAHAEEQAARDREEAAARQANTSKTEPVQVDLEEAVADKSTAAERAAIEAQQEQAEQLATANAEREAARARIEEQQAQAREEEQARHDERQTDLEEAAAQQAKDAEDARRAEEAAQQQAHAEEQAAKDREEAAAHQAAIEQQQAKDAEDARRAEEAAQEQAHAEEQAAKDREEAAAHQAAIEQQQAKDAEDARRAEEAAQQQAHAEEQAAKDREEAAAHQAAIEQQQAKDAEDARRAEEAAQEQAHAEEQAAKDREEAAAHQAAIEQQQAKDAEDARRAEEAAQQQAHAEEQAAKDHEEAAAHQAAIEQQQAKDAEDARRAEEAAQEQAHAEEQAAKDREEAAAHQAAIEQQQAKDAEDARRAEEAAQEQAHAEEQAAKDHEEAAAHQAAIEQQQAKDATAELVDQEPDVPIEEKPEPEPKPDPVEDTSHTATVEQPEPAEEKTTTKIDAVDNAPEPEPQPEPDPVEDTSHDTTAEQPEPEPEPEPDPTPDNSDQGPSP